MEYTIIVVDQIGTASGLQLLEKLVRDCIRADWRRGRQADLGHEYNLAEIAEMNRYLDPEMRVDGGYAFLEEGEGIDGMIRLFSGDANPRWSFRLRETSYDTIIVELN